MKRFPGFFLVFLLLLFSVGIFVRGIFQSNLNNTQDYAEYGVVVVVYDGDTIMVRFDSGKEKKVRLIGVDSSEIADPREEVQFQAYLSKRFVFHFLYRKKIKLSYDWEREDKYGRILAYAWTEENELFNERIIREGFARAFLKFPFREDYRKKFIDAEQVAQKQKRGLWSKEPYPTFSAREAKKNTGKLASVKYLCAGVQKKGNFLFLKSKEGTFSSLIPRENLHLFLNVQSFLGKVITVSGFLEEYSGEPQIMIFFPRQIKEKAGSRGQETGAEV